MKQPQENMNLYDLHQEKKRKHALLWVVVVFLMQIVILGMYYNFN